MITNYIELTMAHDQCRRLIDIDDLVGVKEHRRESYEVVEGQRKRIEYVECHILIGEATMWFPVTQSYELVKHQINQIRKAMTTNEQR